MYRWNVLTRLVSSATNQWRTATSAIPGCPSLAFTSAASRASYSSSFSPSTASTSQPSPLSYTERATMSEVHQVTDPSSPLAVALDRGAYDERTIPHVTGYNVKSLAVVENGKHVEVTWEDGKVSRYHSLWLRHTCFCPQCKFDLNGQPKMRHDLIPSDLVVSSAADDGEGCLLVQWTGEEGHTGVFPLKFLKFRCYSPHSVNERVEATRMRYTTDMTMPELTYEEVMESEEGVLRWVTILNERGICLIKGLPVEDGMGRKVCERVSWSVAPNVLFGYVDELRHSPGSISAGYNTEELKLHQDLVYYASPPGLQVLYCLKFSPEVEGGESVFADMFHVAETFREQYPEDFKVLASVPATYETIHYNREWPVHLTVKRPVFELNDRGDLVGVRHQPHHMGPLEVAEELIEPFYAAYKKFYIMMNEWPYRFIRRLQPGDMVSINNRRFAHGRAAFVNKGNHERHLQGCYIDISELKSRTQALSNMLGDGRLVHRMGDYDYK